DGHAGLGTDDAAALTLVARVGNDLALAAAAVAQRHVHELTEDRLLHATNLAAALAARALDRLAARLHAVARAARAGHVFLQGDLFGGTENGLFERQLDVVAQVLAALDPLPRAASA